MILRQRAFILAPLFMLCSLLISASALHSLPRSASLLPSGAYLLTQNNVTQELSLNLFNKQSLTPLVSLGPNLTALILSNSGLTYSLTYHNASDTLLFHCAPFSEDNPYQTFVASILILPSLETELLCPIQTQAGNPQVTDSYWLWPTVSDSATPSTLFFECRRPNTDVETPVTSVSGCENIWQCALSVSDYNLTTASDQFCGGSGLSYPDPGCSFGAVGVYDAAKQQFIFIGADKDPWLVVSQIINGSSSAHIVQHVSVLGVPSSIFQYDPVHQRVLLGGSDNGSVSFTEYDIQTNQLRPLVQFPNVTVSGPSCFDVVANICYAIGYRGNNTDQLQLFWFGLNDASDDWGSITAESLFGTTPMACKPEMTWH